MGAPKAKILARHLEQWANQELKKLVKKAQVTPGLKGRFPKGDSSPITTGLAFVSNAEMKKLNRKHRGKDKATDVLSFSPPPVFWEAGYLGELVIGLPTAVSQARELGHDLKSEVLVLLAHGLLHLLGFDHELGPKEAKVMARFEAKILPPALLKKGVLGLIKR